MKIGLFFGTFDPPHLGHFEIVKKLINTKNFEEIWIVLSPLSPFKQNNLITSFHHRTVMLQKTFLDLNNVKICDVELKLSQPNYTIETLNYLQKSFPNYKYSIIMGSDNFNKIHLWKDSQKIIKKFPLFVYPRKDHPLNNKLIKLNSIASLVHMKTIPISSSTIRSKIYSTDISNQLMPAVKDYILKNKLYI